MLASLLLPMSTPKPAPAVRAELTLTADRKTVAPDQNAGYHLVIRNTGREPLRLLLPQDGSDIGLRNPAMEWTLPDRVVPEMGFGRCGNTNSIREEDYFTLAPGARREISTWGPNGPELTPGDNRISVSYDIDATRVDRGFDGLFFQGEPPRWYVDQKAKAAKRYEALTPISLHSNVVRVTLKAAP